MDESKKNPLFSGIVAGYLILLAHLLLIIVLATAVVFIQTLAEYVEYVLAGGLLLIIGSAVFFFRILKQNGKQILNTMKNPAFHNQNLEINLLGGLASVSFNKLDKNQQLMLANQAPTIQALPDPQPSSPQNEILRLADLYDRDLISKEEFQQLKDEILNPLTKATSSFRLQRRKPCENRSPDQIQDFSHRYDRPDTFYHQPDL